MIVKETTLFLGKIPDRLKLEAAHEKRTKTR